MDSLNVLIVDDSATDAKLVARELLRTGKSIDFERVETAVTMRAALERRSWDVVISDSSMPKFSARGALALLKEMQVDCPFIIVSGTIGEDVAVDAMRAGAHDYVLKDKLARLAPAVEREIRESQNREGRRQSSSALAASDARYRRIVETTNQGIWMIDLEGRTTFMNGQMATMLGYDRDELLGVSVVDSLDEERRDATLLELARSCEVAVQFETKLKRKDGSAVWVLVDGAPTFGEPGHSEGVLAMVMDVTERKKTEEALRCSQTDLLEQLRIAALTADVGMALALGDSLSDIMRRCAEAMVTHLDVSLARIRIATGKDNVMELQGSAGIGANDEGPSPMPKFDLSVLTEGRQGHFSNDIANDPGMIDREWAKREQIVSFAGYPLLVAGQLVGVVGVYARHPLSEPVLTGLRSLADALAVGVQRKIAEEASHSLEVQLRHAQKMEAVGRLAGGIAHDFNNVLSVVLSYAEMVLGDLKVGDPLREDVNEIHKAGMRAAALTRQLLMFSRRQVVAPKVLDLNDVLSGMAKMLQRLVGEDVTFAAVPGAALGRVRVDPGSMEQVIMNLAVNARDAMPTGGTLTMKTENVVLDGEYASTHLGAKAGSYVMLSAEDTGSGMDAATLARIFEPFFTTKELGKGTGLGLSTVFGIVQQSGGHLWVSSEPGMGATFKVYLPRVEEMAEELRPLSDATTVHGSETVLLVEDEQQVRDVARGILRRQGYTVIEARDAAEASLLSRQHAGPIHLLLTDVVMPGMNGPDLAKRLVQERPEMKVLCMSGYTDDAAVRNGVMKAAFAYLQKPLTVGALARKVRDVLDSRQG
jgi:PAS domain S-box-containing protein